MSSSRCRRRSSCRRHRQIVVAVAAVDLVVADAAAIVSLPLPSRGVVAAKAEIVSLPFEPLMVLCVVAGICGHVPLLIEMLSAKAIGPCKARHGTVTYAATKARHHAVIFVFPRTASRRKTPRGVAVRDSLSR
jgi:hypothetical protein